MVSVQAYGSLEAGSRREPVASRAGRYYVVLAGLALITLSCVVVMSSRGGATTELETPSYSGWLGTLTGDPESSDDVHEQRSETANAALPFSKEIGSMQGKDFVKDVVEPSPSGNPSSPWEDVPKKLAEFKENVEAEMKEYEELKKIVGFGAPPAPEALVVHVAERGPPGPIGPRGDRGAFGQIGPQGPEGPPGPPGDKGKRGERGDIGPTGLKGFPGAEGKRGYEGKVGQRGTQGAVGIKGKKGNTGMPGDVGPPGLQGDNGEEGSRGAVGNVGAPGPQGNGETKWILTKTSTTNTW